MHLGRCLLKSNSLDGRYYEGSLEDSEHAVGPEFETDLFLFRIKTDVLETESIEPSDQTAAWRNGLTIDSALLRPSIEDFVLL